MRLCMYILYLWSVLCVGGERAETISILVNWQKLKLQKSRTSSNLLVVELHVGLWELINNNHIFHNKNYIRLLKWFFFNLFFPHPFLLFCLSLLLITLHFLFILPPFLPSFFPLFPLLFRSALPANFLYQWWASDRTGFCDFSWRSNYLNCVCDCVCRAKALLLTAVPSHVDLSSDTRGRECQSLSG